MKKIIICFALLGAISIDASGEDGRKSPTLREMQPMLLGGKIGRKPKRKRPGLGLSINTGELGTVAESVAAQQQAIAAHSAVQNEGGVAKKPGSVIKDREELVGYFKQLTRQQSGGSVSATSVVDLPVSLKKQEEFPTPEAAVRSHHQQCNRLKDSSILGHKDTALLRDTWEELGRSYFCQVQGKDIDANELGFWNEMVALKYQFDNAEVQSAIQTLVNSVVASTEERCMK